MKIAFYSNNSTKLSWKQNCYTRKMKSRVYWRNCAMSRNRYWTVCVSWLLCSRYEEKRAVQNAMLSPAFYSRTSVGWLVFLKRDQNTCKHFALYVKSATFIVLLLPTAQSYCKKDKQKQLFQSNADFFRREKINKRKTFRVECSISRFYTFWFWDVIA